MLPQLVHHLPRRLSRVSLTTQFALVSLLILLAGMLVIGWWVAKQIETGVMNRTASVTASFVTSAMMPVLNDLNTHGEVDPEHVAALDRMLFETDLGQRVVSFKVWSRDGRILYSPQRDLVGRQFDVSPDLEKALNGETVSHISNLQAPENVYERERFSRLVETYTPWRLSGTGEPLGAVEFYEDTEALRVEIRAVRTVQHAVIAGLLTYPLFRATSR